LWIKLRGGLEVSAPLVSYRLVSDVFRCVCDEVCGGCHILYIAVVFRIVHGSDLVCVFCVVHFSSPVWVSRLSLESKAELRAGMTVETVFGWGGDRIQGCMAI